MNLHIDALNVSFRIENKATILRYGTRYPDTFSVVNSNLNKDHRPSNLCTHPYRQNDHWHLLSEENKRAQIAFIIRFVDKLTLLYSPMYDVFPLDGKWFHMTRASQRIYLSPN